MPEQIAVGRIKRTVRNNKNSASKTDDEFKIVLPGTSQPLHCFNYYEPLYEHLYQKQLSEWMELEFQGAITRQEAFDMQCSQEIYKNNSLADKLVKFQ